MCVAGIIHIYSVMGVWMTVKKTIIRIAVTEIKHIPVNGGIDSCADIPIGP